MSGPKVICHMRTLIDGRVTGEFPGMPQYECAAEIYCEISRA